MGRAARMHCFPGFGKGGNVFSTYYLSALENWNQKRECQARNARLLLRVVCATGFDARNPRVAASSCKNGEAEEQQCIISCSDKAGIMNMHSTYPQSEQHAEKANTRHAAFCFPPVPHPGKPRFVPEVLPPRKPGFLDANRAIIARFVDR